MYKTNIEHLTIAGIAISLLQIKNVDELYEHLIAKGDDHEDMKDERIPYWADLWPSAIALSEHLIKSNAINSGISVHDMGCGLGLPGIVAGMLGAKVLFTDYLTEALDFAKQNWELNCKSEALFEKMDWRKPDVTFKADLLLASDVAYERKSFEFLPNAFRTLTNPGGKIIISEPRRLYAQEFFDSLQFQGFQVSKFEYPLRHKNFNHSINVFELTLSNG
jgi:predicted nicotinamide N-methyase